ncbi:hypothetical protein MRB53_011730 [Persea americana]|uniref:Uncharacterized protein n=1 Tax=Persea americana TaxID=3435 RepID=A0ACC2LVP5_PERAE|nr:hypothetical protein MRB53_011730 [Persea americana]
MEIGESKATSSVGFDGNADFRMGLLRTWRIEGLLFCFFTSLRIILFPMAITFYITLWFPHLHSTSDYYLRYVPPLPPPS